MATLLKGDNLKQNGEMYFYLGTGLLFYIHSIPNVAPCSSFTISNLIWMVDKEGEGSKTSCIAGLLLLLREFHSSAVAAELNRLGETQGSEGQEGKRQGDRQGGQGESSGVGRGVEKENSEEEVFKRHTGELSAFS